MLRRCSKCSKEFRSNKNNKSGLCYKCKKKEWKQANRDKERAYSKKFYDNNKEKFSEYGKRWRFLNKEHKKARDKLYYENNKDRLNAASSNRQRANWNHIKAKRDAIRPLLNKRLKEWRQAHPEKVAIWDHNKRAFRLSREGVLTITDIMYLQNREQVCSYCGKDVIQDAHLDHIVPLSRGGSNWGDNIQLLCSLCNMRKGAKMPWDYERLIHFDRDPCFWHNFKLYHTPKCVFYTGEEEMFKE